MNENTNRVGVFSQDDYLNVVGCPSANGGVCHLFALKWAALIVTNKAAGTADRIAQCKKYAQEVRILYKSFGDRWERDVVSRHLASIRGRLGWKACIRNRTCMKWRARQDSNL